MPPIIKDLIRLDRLYGLEPVDEQLGDDLLRLFALDKKVRLTKNTFHKKRLALPGGHAGRPPDLCL